MATYKPYKSKHTIKPLTLNRRIMDGRVARFWGIKPWELRNFPPDQAAELHALYDIEQEIEWYGNSEERKLLDKDRQDPGNKSGRTFGKR